VARHKRKAAPDEKRGLETKTTTTNEGSYYGTQKSRQQRCWPD
jgi:hypothetical protein